MRKYVRDYVTRNADVDHYVDAVAREMEAAGEEADDTQASRIAERAVSMLVEEEIDSLKKVLAATRGADKVAIDPTRVSAVYKSGFLERLNNVEPIAEIETAYEWGQQDEDYPDDVVFRSILDTQLQHIGPGLPDGTIRIALLGQIDLESVKAIKNWTNLQRVSREPLYARELATGVYYAAIAAAQIHHDERISSQQDAVLARAYGSVLGADWLEEDVSTLLTKAQDQLS